MRTPPNDENSISGQMARRGMRPQYTLDQMPGQVVAVESARNAHRQARPGIPSIDMGNAWSGSAGPISPEVLAKLQEAMRQAQEMGGLDGDTPYGNDIFSGGMGPNGGPSPRRLARKARMADKKKRRQDRMGGVKPKPTIGLTDGNDVEPDSDMDDAGGAMSADYGNSKMADRDPNQGYRDRFAEMAKPKPAMQGGQGGPMDREKLKAYLQQMGMK